MLDLLQQQANAALSGGEHLLSLKALPPHMSLELSSRESSKMNHVTSVSPRDDHSSSPLDGWKGTSELSVTGGSGAGRALPPATRGEDTQ